MKKMKSKDDVQKALDYAVYMMVSGNFKGCHVRSRIAEKKLYLHFCEMSGSKRDAIEDNCAFLADRILMNPANLPISIWDETVSVAFSGHTERKATSVVFLGKGWVLEITSFYKGEKKQSFYISFSSKDLNKKGIVHIPRKK